MVIDPSWLFEDPRLTAVLRIAPACSLREHFFGDHDTTRAHAYQISVPSLAQSDLEQRFRNAVREFGYTVRADPVGVLGFHDEAKRISGDLGGGLVTVIFGRSGDPRERVAKLAAQFKMETWGLVDALGERDTWNISVDRMVAETTFTAELVVSEPKRATVDAWARERKLERIDRAWVRKVRTDAPEVSAISIDLNGAKLFVLETRASQLSRATLPACREHPSRKAARSTNTAQPKESDDELIRRMMGR